MLKRVCAAVFLLVAMACGGGNSTPTSPSATPAPTTFSLSGQVTDSATGAAISGATLSIADGPNAGRSATTDASGNYNFTALQQSGFTVNVTATGYLPSSRGVTLTSNQTVSLQLTRISFQGTWSGTTGQGRALSFVVNSANGITTLTATYLIQGSNCSSSTTSTTTFGTPVPITNNSFTFQGTSLIFSGTFSSTSAASGTATFNNPPATGCSGIAVTTWTATKN